MRPVQLMVGLHCLLQPEYRKSTLLKSQHIVNSNQIPEFEFTEARIVGSLSDGFCNEVTKQTNMMQLSSRASPVT
jgi:hypothetical protein